MCLKGKECMGLYLHFPVYIGIMASLLSIGILTVV
jgi:hypothetical protein